MSVRNRGRTKKHNLNKILTYCATRDEVQRKKCKETVPPNQALVVLIDLEVEEEDCQEVADYFQKKIGMFDQVNGAIKKLAMLLTELNGNDFYLLQRTMLIHLQTSKNPPKESVKSVYGSSRWLMEKPIYVNSKKRQTIEIKITLDLLRTWLSFMPFSLTALSRPTRKKSSRKTKKFTTKSTSKKALDKNDAYGV